MISGGPHWKVTCLTRGAGAEIESTVARLAPLVTLLPTESDGEWREVLVLVVGLTLRAEIRREASSPSASARMDARR